MIVVDVNVVAYFFIEGERTAAARRLWQVDPEWRLPHLWRHEYLNVLSTYARHGGAGLGAVTMLWEQATDLLADAGTEADWVSALTLSVEHGISAYDAQYIALAQSLGTVCVTEDRRLLETFPQLARSMAAIGS